MEKNPATINGRQMTPHAMQNAAGRYHSIMCMAFEAGAIANNPAIAMLAFNKMFCLFVMFFSLLFF